MFLSSNWKRINLSKNWNLISDKTFRVFQSTAKMTMKYLICTSELSKLFKTQKKSPLRGNKANKKSYYHSIETDGFNLLKNVDVWLFEIGQSSSIIGWTF